METEIQTATIIKHGNHKAKIDEDNYLHINSLCLSLDRASKNEIKERLNDIKRVVVVIENNLDRFIK